MGVHGDDGGKVLHAQVPHGFGDAEFHQVDVEHLLDGFGVILRRSADGVQVDRAALLQSR